MDKTKFSKNPKFLIGATVVAKRYITDKWNAMISGDYGMVIGRYPADPEQRATSINVQAYRKGKNGSDVVFWNIDNPEEFFFEEKDSV